MLRSIHAFVDVSNLAVTAVNLGVLSFNTAELLSVAVCKVIHCLLSDIKSISSMVDGEDVDGLSIVRHTVAGATLQDIRTRDQRGVDNDLLEGNSTPQRLGILQCKDMWESGPEFATRSGLSGH